MIIITIRIFTTSKN